MNVTLLQPGNLERVDDGKSVELRWSWRDPQLLLVIPFAVVWNAFLVFWYAMAIRAPWPEKLLPLLFPVLHLALGVSLIYYVIAALFNRTHLRADGQALEVRHGPIFAPGSGVFPARSISAIEVREGHRQNGRSTASLYLHFNDRKPRRIVYWHTDRTRLEYVRSELCRVLRVPAA